MLEQAMKDQVTNLFSGLKHTYIFQINVATAHANRSELIELLNDVASCSPQISCTIAEGDDLSFTIIKDDKPSNIIFRAVPNGHEFTSLLIAVLNMDGIGKNLPDDTLTKRILSLQGDVEVKSYISLTCTNCPEVVQALNVMAMLNPNVKHQVIDGAINKEEVEALAIQAVPTVYVNGKQFHVGRSSLGELVSKLETQLGTNFSIDKNSTNKAYDVVVIGGGPAGVSSAIYSARKGLSVAIVAEKIGGQVTETVSIENMISVPKTTGAELTANLLSHLTDYKIDILDNRLVSNVEVVDGYKHLTTSLGEKLITPALIVATGASWRRLGVPGEQAYIGSGVAFCTHCDGPFYKGKKVVVVGGGNSGLEAAIDLSSIATDVTVLEFLDELKGDQILQDKLKTLSNVKVITGAQTIGVDGNGTKVTALRYKNRSNGDTETLSIDGVFVQIGLVANSQVVANIVDTNRMGEIEIDAHCRTKQPGIYAAGDVSVVPYKQIVIAMGEGSKAALSAFEDRIKNRQIV